MEAFKPRAINIQETSTRLFQRDLFPIPKW